MKIIQIEYFGTKMLVSIFKSFLKEKLKRLLMSLISYKEDEYLTRTQTAKFLNTSVTTLWRLDRTQRLPATRLFGRVLYSKSDLLKYFKQTN